MASLKKLVYIFIPVLAILLMSHNTFAANMFTPVTCYHDTGGGNQCINYPLVTGNTLDIISISRQNNTSLNAAAGEDFLWALNVRAYGNVPAQFSINLANGYPSQASVHNIIQDCNTANQITSCNVLVTGTLNTANFNIQLAGQITAFGTVYQIDSLYFSTDYSIERATYTRLGVILEYLQNHPEPTAQDIADAVNNDQETETQNASNDSQTAGSSSSQDATAATSSLISTIGGFVGVVTAASPTNCVINGNMGHLNMGNLDLCANPVPSYIQVIGTIILICAVIPLAIILFNRFIGLFRSFQG